MYPRQAWHKRLDELIKMFNSWKKYGRSFSREGVGVEGGMKINKYYDHKILFTCTPLGYNWTIFEQYCTLWHIPFPGKRMCFAYDHASCHGCARLDDCAPAPSSKGISHMIHHHFYLTLMIDMCVLWTGCYLMGVRGKFLVNGSSFHTGLKINIEAWDVMLPPTLLVN